MRHRKWGMVGLALTAMAVLVARPASADVRLMMHQMNDPAPRQISAAVDFGLVAFSLLITWSTQRFT